MKLQYTKFVSDGSRLILFINYKFVYNTTMLHCNKDEVNEKKVLTFFLKIRKRTKYIYSEGLVCVLLCPPL